MFSLNWRLLFSPKYVIKQDYIQYFSVGFFVLWHNLDESVALNLIASYLRKIKKSCFNFS